VDTSVWIEFFRQTRGRPGDILSTLLSEDRVVLCGVVEMEIVQGLRDKELRDVQAALRLLPYVETTRDDFVEAGNLWRALRQKGKTIPATDTLIAQLCLKRNLWLLTLDAHFNGIERLKLVELAMK